MYRKRDAINTIIGLCLMLFFQFIPLDGSYITPMGLKVIGVFLGTIYLWTAGFTIWPSILAIVLLGYYNFMPMGEVLSSWMGNPVLVMIFFLLILVGTFQYHQGTKYIVRFFMSLKIVEKRPWIFTFIMLLGTYAMGAFVNPWAAVFLFLPVIQNTCLELGFEKKDTYTKVMTIATVMAALLGFPTAYYNGTVLGLNSTFTQVSGGEYEVLGGPYMITGLVIGIASIIGITLATRFIIRPEVGPLKELTVEKLTKEPLPPMNLTQKIVSASLLIFILAMLIPAFFPQLALSDFLSENINGIAMTLVGILAMIHINGQPVLDFPKIAANNFSWQTYFLIGTSLTLGSALTHESVGFTAWLESVLTPLFINLDIMPFIIIYLILGIIMTNLMNSAVFVLMSHPIILTYASISGANPVPIVALVTLSALATAVILPSASPYAATLYGQVEYIEPKDIYKYALVFVLVETVVILALGVPVARLVF